MFVGFVEKFQKKIKVVIEMKVQTTIGGYFTKTNAEKKSKRL